ncbi:hypothetical protein [Pseudomonas syringae]|uniref:hypothetical protein n=1 Tax=Pseudomonas syringae TaxID=317 RepID=UPI000D9F4EAF|nr:hypothetical protein [Pseudomonas syringae]MCH5512285.1 hypothetical protein [Pseudomonas syringae pv. syringae]MCH5640993.1 hypothetical protein [Pseudomonas syringae pv. syringae]MCH7430138.1 hypothetical protein [Pseudomonas syringae pv. syringae]PYD12531.1 hypothetical protein DND47_22370 [Pseudomonas syringae pv. syringae]
MKKEDLIYFESELQEELKTIKCEELAVTAVKRCLRFRIDKEIVATLNFQHLVKSHEFMLSGRVFGGPIFNCMSKMDMPYKSNLGSNSCFSFITDGRQDKKFSPSIYGTIVVPSPDHASEVCKHIRRALEEYYIPLVVGCILPSERTIDDVIYSPRDYSYPAAFIHCAVSCNPLIVKNDMLEKIKSNKHIIKNKIFDLKLLDACLS